MNYQCRATWSERGNMIRLATGVAQRGEARLLHAEHTTAKG